MVLAQRSSGIIAVIRIAFVKNEVSELEFLSKYLCKNLLFRFLFLVKRDSSHFQTTNSFLHVVFISQNEFRWLTKTDVFLQVVAQMELNEVNSGNHKKYSIKDDCCTKFYHPSLG